MERGGLSPRQLTLAVAAVVGIVVALFVFSRPADRVSDPEALASSDPDRTEPPATIVPSSVESNRRPAIMPFNSNLPDDLPGVISGLDIDGSVIVIAADEEAPVELKLGLETLVPGGGQTHLGVLGSGMVPLSDADFTVRGTRLDFVQADGRPGGSLELGRIMPDLAGGALLVDTSRGFQSVIFVPLGERRPPLVWEIEGEGAEVMGIWNDSLVLHQANRTWLLDQAGQVTPIADGQLLSFDGRHLARLVCPEPNQCEIAVGPPDAPATRVVPVPESIRLFPTSAWTGSVAVSPDGLRLATSGRFGVLSFPVVIDMETGEDTVLVDGMNDASPVAWSPDSQWLCYLFNDDLMVWSLADGRSWQIQVDRDLQTLLWR